ncbi:hypothetical protein CU016_1769 [Enterococcus lactis]|nr:hypothetical protein [Enterococcus lactis]MBL5015004.1 hypothetical protein [Enterococcus lactis]
MRKKGNVTKIVSHSLFPNKRCSISCPSVFAQQMAKYEELFFRCFSNTQVKALISQSLP